MAEAGPSTSRAPASELIAGESPYHESSQFRDWRYSPSRLASIRQALNEKSVEVVARNTELEKEAQKKLGHDIQGPPPSTAYLSVGDELLLLRVYLSQASQIIKSGFGMPEVVESTAMSYLKRFYLKNSVMEWHPRIIMPTCIYLAAKTTNYPILMQHFIPKFAKLDPQEVIDTEFVVSQSLSFQFWVRTPEKSLRGWGLDFQSMPKINIDAVQKCLVAATKTLSTSRLTDAEFIYTPSQIALASLRINDKALVDSFLDWKYSTASEGENMYGMEKNRLTEILESVEEMIKGAEGDIDMKKAKDVDKRLKQCSNPAKIPGTALYLQRKEEQQKKAAAQKAEKTLRIKQEMSDRESVFGDVIIPPPGGKKAKEKDTRTWSPRVSMGSDRGMGSPAMQETGMGVKDEAMGDIVGGKGLKDVGILHEE